VYKSLSGFTEKYARWIAEEFTATCIDIKTFRPNMVNESTVLIFGGSLHAIGINGYQMLINKLTKCKYKELVLFAVGASPYKKGIETEIVDANLKTPEERRGRLFYLRGGFNFSKLDIRNKILMQLLKLKILSKNERKRSADEKGMLASYDRPMDATKRENIADIVSYIKTLQ
jgi:hypothetical protein